MNGQDCARHIRDSENFGVVMFYGAFDFTPGSNFLFAVIPARGRGAQWHRDVIPALKRYLKKFDDRFTNLVTGSEAMHGLTDSLLLLWGRRRGKNDRLWIVFEWEELEGEKCRGIFREVDFDAPDSGVEQWKREHGE